MTTTAATQLTLIGGTMKRPAKSRKAKTSRDVVKAQSKDEASIEIRRIAFWQWFQKERAARGNPSYAKIIAAYKGDDTDSRDRQTFDNAAKNYRSPEAYYKYIAAWLGMSKEAVIAKYEMIQTVSKDTINGSAKLVDFISEVSKASDEELNAIIAYYRMLEEQKKQRGN